MPFLFCSLANSYTSFKTQGLCSLLWETLSFFPVHSVPICCMTLGKSLQPEMEVCMNITSLKACFEPQDNKQTLDALKVSQSLGEEREFASSQCSMCVHVYLPLLGFCGFKTLLF